MTKNRTNEVPRSGTHNGIKYNKKWTRIKLCRQCKRFFHPVNGRQRLCSEQCKKWNNTDYQSYWYNQLPEEKKAEIRRRRKSVEKDNLIGIGYENELLLKQIRSG